MKLIFVVSFLAAIATASSAAAQAPAKRGPTVEDRIRRIENGLAPHVAIKGAPPVRMKLADRMRHYRAPGVSVAVINDGRVEWARGWGLREIGRPDPVTAETLFNAGSVSKPVGAMGALRLVQDGKLALTGDVNGRLTSWKIPENEFTRLEKVSLLRLLNHSSGLPLYGGDGRPPEGPIPTLAEAFRGANPPPAPEFTPGARQQYSSAGAGVVQLLMSDVTGRPFDAVMQDTVFGRLGMKHSTFRQSPPTGPWVVARGHGSVSREPVSPLSPSSPLGFLWTSPADLGRFMAELQRAHQPGGGLVLSEPYGDRMMTPNRNEWSLGLQVITSGRTPWFWHDGSVPGFTALFVGYNWTGQEAVVMINEDVYHGLKLAHEIVLGVAREYGWPEHAPIVKTVVSADPRRLSDYPGLYEIDEGYPVTLVERDGKLWLIWALGGVFEMHPEGPDTFFIVREEAPTFTFKRDASGRVTGVTRAWRGGESPGARTIPPPPSQRGTARFHLPGHTDALVVSLVGGFNAWKPQQTVCGRDAGGWTCRIDLPPGRHAYAFLVDNERLPDPLNPRIERDAEGLPTSVRVVAPG